MAPFTFCSRLTGLWRALRNFLAKLDRGGHNLFNLRDVYSLVKFACDEPCQKIQVHNQQNDHQCLKGFCGTWMKTHVPFKNLTLVTQTMCRTKSRTAQLQVLADRYGAPESTWIASGSSAAEKHAHLETKKNGTRCVCRSALQLCDCREYSSPARQTRARE
jgi:hypothetical protein